MERIGVVGGGLMGSGIAEVCARADLDVVVVEDGADASRRARERIASSLQRAEQRGKVDSADRVLERLQVVPDLDALHARDLVVEAILEDEAAKTDVFRRLDKIVVSE